VDRRNDFQQAGERYRAHEDWERDDLISNLVSTLKPARQHIQERMVWLFSQCDEDYGRRVAEGLGIPVPASDPYAERARPDGAGARGTAVPVTASSGNGANGTNGNGAPIGANPDEANAAPRQAEQIAHDAKPY
jgi:catalase